MNIATPSGVFEEIELKLALPNADAAALAQCLGRTPLLARRKPKRQLLRNVYYDTPEQVVRQQRISLRLRQVGGADPQWLQTLKTGGSSDSALSQRGEWETAVTGAALSLPALEGTPWSRIDPDGVLFAALAPCFVTTFERTTWLVRRRDRSCVEVALDIGQIEANGNTTPLCELEFELKEGLPEALFVVAKTIAASVAVMPMSQSKAQRGYAVAQGTLHAPQQAQPVALSAERELSRVARLVLREMWSQFTTNLQALRGSDATEIVHQARVGWRRFRSGLRLFKPLLRESALPAWEALRPLLALLGETRDLDVARTQTLPALGPVYGCADRRRERAWKRMLEVLADSARDKRRALRQELEMPSVGASLLGITQWLECGFAAPAMAAVKASPQVSLRGWSLRRISKLRRRLRLAQRAASPEQNDHRTRILAKRLRYGMEALRPLLPKRRTQVWYRQATELQSSIGSKRDLLQASALVSKFDLDRGLQEFLRGLTLGKSGVTPLSN